MTWPPTKAILQRLPASKFLSVSWKLTTGLISFKMTKKTPFWDMQISWFISRFNTHSQLTCMLLCLSAWALPCYALVDWVWQCCTKLFHTFLLNAIFTEMSHTKPEDQRIQDKHYPQTITPTQRIKEERAATLLWLLSSCPKHHIILQTGLSVYWQSRRMNLAQARWLNSSATDSQRIHICVNIQHKSKG